MPTNDRNKFAGFVLAIPMAITGGKAVLAENPPNVPLADPSVGTTTLDPHKFFGPSVMAQELAKDPKTHVIDQKLKEAILRDSGPGIILKVIGSPTGCAEVSISESGPFVMQNGKPTTKPEYTTTISANLCIARDATSPYGIDIVPKDNGKFNVVVTPGDTPAAAPQVQPSVPKPAPRSLLHGAPTTA